jgi:hypothetical protein
MSGTSLSILLPFFRHVAFLLAHLSNAPQNADVLRHWTMLNVACNVDEDEGGVEQACSRASFYAGDWSSLSPVMRPAGAEPFDIVLMAETVYSPDSYDRLRDLICQLQAGCEQATVYLASKTYYFGVGAFGVEVASGESLP